jgi:hypothetical protein
VQTAGQPVDELGRVRRVASRFRPPRRSRRAAVADVFQHVDAKITGSCGTSASCRRTFARIGRGEVDAIDAHDTDLRIVEAKQQLEYRRLAGARWPTSATFSLAPTSSEKRSSAVHRAATDSGTSRFETQRARTVRGHGNRMRRRMDRRLDTQQLEQALRRAAARCRSPRPR